MRLEAGRCADVPCARSVVAVPAVAGAAIASRTGRPTGCAAAAASLRTPAATPDAAPDVTVVSSIFQYRRSADRASIGGRPRIADPCGVSSDFPHLLDRSHPRDKLRRQSTPRTHGRTY